MELKDIKEVLSFAAFRPEADNPAYAWPQRFPKRKSVFVNVNRAHCSWAYLNKKGKIADTGESEGEFSEVIGHLGDQWKSHTEDGWLGISINNRFIISLEHNLSRKKGWEEDIRTNPKSILGTKYDRGKRYALHHNPETSASLLMACDDSMIQSIEESMRSYNLKTARICCGLFATTSHLLNRIVYDPSYKDQDLIVVTWSHGSLCVLRQTAGQWKEFRCRSGLPTEDLSSIAQIIKPFTDAAESNTRVLYMGDDQNSESSSSIMQMFENLQVTDVTEKNNLWEILGKH